MERRLLTLAALGLLFAAALPARADLVLYLIPNTNVVVTLQGKATVNPGRTVSFRHPRLGTLVFGMEDTRIHSMPTTETLFTRKLGLGAGRKNAEEVLAAARFALKHGLLKEFHAAIDKLLEIDPQHKAGRRVRELRRKMDQPLGESEYEEAKLKKLVERPDMKVKKSKHFILLYDTPDKPAKDRSKPRADERLDLLETVYETFLTKFYLENVKLEVPKERLMVVLFAREADYQRFIQTLDPALQSAAGFWVPSINVSVFYDQGSGPEFIAMRQQSQQLNELKREALRVKAGNTKDIVRMANTIALLVELEQENQDITVVSHEATHHMAGNTGLLPREVQIPAWVHEGLATYFEAPRDATWSGMGAVNEERLQWYRELQKDREHSNIDFITQDKIFTHAASHGSRLHGYGQAWALTHFLMERHFDKLAAYYRALAEYPPGDEIGPRELKRTFSNVFGKDYAPLDNEWRAYMNSLRTDFERIVAEAQAERR